MDFQDLVLQTKNGINGYYSKFINNPADKPLKVLIAVSGGPDSLLCLQIFMALRSLINVDIAVVNFNHKSSPNDYYKEENYIKNLCEKIEMTRYVYYMVDDYLYIKNGKTSQDIYRNFRIRNLVSVATQGQYDFVVTGHNGEDLVDTFLMRLGKATDYWGITSIAQWKYMYGVTFFRPLLNVPRLDIENIMKNTPYFLDPTRRNNYQRNRLRKIHNHLEFAGVQIINIAQSINKQIEYQNIIKKSIKINVETSYNISIIKEYSALNLLEKIENIRVAVFNILPNFATNLNKLELLIEKIALSPNKKQVLGGALFIHKKSKDLLIITPEYASKKMLNNGENKYSISMNFNGIAANQNIIWGKRHIFCIRGPYSQVHIMEFNNFLELFNDTVTYHSINPEIPIDVILSSVVVICYHNNNEEKFIFQNQYVHINCEGYITKSIFLDKYITIIP